MQAEVLLEKEWLSGGHIQGSTKDGFQMVVTGSFTGQYEGQVSDGCHRVIYRAVRRTGFRWLSQGHLQGSTKDGFQMGVTGSFTGQYGRVSDGCQGVIYRAT